MKTTTIFKLASAPCALAAALCAAPALAQAPTAECIDADADGTCDVADSADSSATGRGLIIVTGSRIPQPNLESANPVAVVTGEDIFETGNTSVGDQLNDLPQLRSTYSQQNSTRNLGNRGLNLLDLRGLGQDSSPRTLVLVNGRRHVAADVLLSGAQVDVNTIPLDLVSRIDVVTGGASGVYGSDAIAGVVNFILKDDYEGVQLRGQNGVSKYGDAGNQYISLLAGKNFADGRGNVAVDFEFSHQQDYYGSGRPNLRTNNTLVLVDNDPGGSANGVADGPDRLFFNDVRAATISLGGLVLVRQPAGGACGSGDGLPFGCTFLFQPDGSLVPQTGARIGTGPNGAFVGGNGSTASRAREGRLLVLSPDLKRYAANLIGHFEISPAFEPFIEAKYVRTEARGSQSGPFFTQGTTIGDPSSATTPASTGGRERVRLDNPFLSAQARALLTQQILAAGVDPNSSAGVAPALTAAQITAINNGSFRFNLRRNWTDFGFRDEQLRRETYRIVAGVRGDFNDDWHYEVFGNYGEHKEHNVITGNVNLQRYALGLDSTRNATGQIVCRSQVDAAAAVSYLTGSNLSANDDPRLAGDIAACVPINPFGLGSSSQAARDYVLTPTTADGKITQLNFGGFLTGDTSGFLNLPGGPVAFSVGGEYRRETLRYDLDDVTQAGYAFYNAIPSFVAPAFRVVEAFGELQLPIIKDKPFFEELTLRANGRISDYKGSTGTVYTYGGEATWKPVRDITLRGTYARAVRAPTLVDLFSAQGQNFAPGFVDPCSDRNLAAGSTNRPANCAAAGRPAGYDFVYIASLETLSGGNPNLREEKADTYTAGVVLQPRFVPGLSLSVDYYDINVKNVITAVSAQDVADSCYDLPSLDNPFCALFQRAGAAGGPAGEIPFQILEGALQEVPANFAKFVARGIDTQVSYRESFDDWTFDMRALWTHTLKRDQFVTPTDPTFADRLLGELGDPKDQVNVDVSLKYKKATLGYQFRWISAMYVNNYEDFNPLNGLPPQNADYASFRKYPDIGYFDVRFGYDVNDNFNIYGGVDNIFDKKPPFGLTGVGAETTGSNTGGSGIYDVRGQFFYVGFRAKLGGLFGGSSE